jgi:predicted metal-dependent hydrolase
LKSWIEFDNQTFFISKAISENYLFHLKHWYGEQCAQFANQYLPLWANKIQVRYQKIRISDAKTHWGTCNSKGTISISWRMMMTPEIVHHYLFVHELCHLKHLNHSKLFWELVEEIFPHYKQTKKWLKENTHILQSII